MAASVFANSSATTSQDIRNMLHGALEPVSGFARCALLDYPRYPNLGDHLIWLGSLFYLATVAQCSVAYTAGITDFSAEALARHLPEGPIFLLGGGNFGDLWCHHQRFREEIIERYRDRPIVILPQTLFFQQPQKLEKARQVLNRHPNLTLFTRDRISYEIACQAFDHCRVLMAPDLAFQLTDFANFAIPRAPHGLLYHCRTDAELATKMDVRAWGVTPAQISDWPSYQNHWLYDNHWLLRPSQGWAEGMKKMLGIRALGHGFRAVWQRRLSRPREWASLRQWESEFCPHTLLNQVHNPARQHQSWSFVHSAVYQFRQYEIVVTNRLHGHILCTLLGIPHVFLPNSYYKNQGFHQAWTANVSYCRFVADPEEIPAAIAQLRASPTEYSLMSAQEV